MTRRCLWMPAGRPESRHSEAAVELRWPRESSESNSQSCQHGEDFSGLPAALPPHLLVHPLPRAPGQPRRAHFEVVPRKPGARIPIQFCSKRRVRTGRGARPPDRPPCRRRHILRVLQDHARLEICKEWFRLAQRVSESAVPLSPPCALQELAFESSQKYKEGKYIIELAHMIKENGWE